jgi:hypothetical protein
MPRIKSKMLSLRIDPELKEAADRAAAEDRRTLTTYIEMLIEADLRAREAKRTTAAPKRGRAK